MAMPHVCPRSIHSLDRSLWLVLTTGQSLPILQARFHYQVGTGCGQSPQKTSHLFFTTQGTWLSWTAASDQTLSVTGQSHRTCLTILSPVHRGRGHWTDTLRFFRNKHPTGRYSWAACHAMSLWSFIRQGVHE